MAEKRLEEIMEVRLSHRQALISQGKVPYPAEVRRTHTIKDLNDNFEEIMRDTTPVMIVGRVEAVRKHGGLAFLDLTDASGKMQLQLTRDEMGDEVFSQLDRVDTGDFLQAAGGAILTKKGERAVLVEGFHIITKSVRPIPSSFHGLKDKEKRYRQREIDLLLNTETRDVIKMKSKVIAWLRNYLIKDGYIEVETPVLQSIPGGAAARPFVTHHNALDIPLYMRISAELYLKRLLVGGFEKVFEIERRFRNEGIDKQHNPEFTMLESQLAYADYEDLMDFTETVLEKMCLDLNGSTDVEWQGTNLSFAKPFVRKSYIELVSEKVGFNILENKDPKAYIEIFEKEGLEIPEVKTYAKLVDELYKELIRPTLIQPTLLYDYPAEMAPLAKTKISDDQVVEKFQLLVHGLELNNCYTELNDPVLQREALEKQQQDYEDGDEEAQRIDEDYLRALEYGMPPNAGWSLGIDRFVMLLTDSPNVRDTITFPLLKPSND